MSTSRVRYQSGSIEIHSGKYYFRFRDAARRRRSVELGTTKELSTAAKLKRAVEQMRAKVNADRGAASEQSMTVDELVVRYRAERMPRRASTARGYEGKLKNHIVPRWGSTPVSTMMTSAYEVERWLKAKDCSPKTKSHLRALLSVLLEYAMLRGFVPVGRNPMELVRIEGATKRRREPKIISYEEFGKLLAELREPYRTMALLAGALGLRCSEIVGLKWQDIDFENLVIHLRQGVVSGIEDELKTIGSKSILPLHAELAEAILRWEKSSNFTRPDDYVFASNAMLGRKPLHSWSAQNQVLSPAGVRAGIGGIGWHDLRHSYRSWLDDTGAPVGVQKDLMRHANIGTTMNIYGRALPKGQREANTNVVLMLKKEAGTL